MRGSAIPPPRNPMCRGLSPYQLSRPASFQPRVYLATRLIFAGTLKTPQRIWRIRDSWGQTWLSKAQGLLARWSPSRGADHTRAAEGFLQLPGGQPHRGGGRGLGRSWLLGSEPLALQLGLLCEPHSGGRVLQGRLHIGLMAPRHPESKGSLWKSATLAGFWWWYTSTSKVLPACLWSHRDKG